jgi:hypothetical protein
MFPGFFRVIAGSHVDLTDNFTSHTEYVRQFAFHARGLEAFDYLLEVDADDIILRAIQTDIGRRQEARKERIQQPVRHNCLTGQDSTPIKDLNRASVRHP